MVMGIYFSGIGDIPKPQVKFLAPKQNNPPQQKLSWMHELILISIIRQLTVVLKYNGCKKTSNTGVQTKFYPQTFHLSINCQNWRFHLKSHKKYFIFLVWYFKYIKTHGIFLNYLYFFLSAKESKKKKNLLLSSFSFSRPTTPPTGEQEKRRTFA